MALMLATAPVDHSVWWWILGIAAIIGVIWIWSAATGSRMRVGTPRSDPHGPADDGDPADRPAASGPDGTDKKG